MVTLITATLFFMIGLAVAGRKDDLPFERACYAATAAISLWLGSTWVLSLTHTLTYQSLLLRLMVLVVIVIGLVWRYRHSLRSWSQVHVSGAQAAAWTAIGAWCGFILWRGAIVPPLSHDALSYHLPKATLIAHAGGYAHLSYLIPAVRTLPVNYELLLAEVIVWTGSDALTEWVSALFYVFFIVAAVALAETWWGRNRLAAAVTALSVAAMPVLLLGSGAHKNDVMVASLMVAGLVAAGRWIAKGDRRALVLLLVSFACATGTKPQAAVLAVSIAPFVAWRLVAELRRGMSWVTFAGFGALSVMAFLLLGGVVYIANIRYEHSLLNGKEYDQSTMKVVPYGDWKNLYQGPYVLVAAPFAPKKDELPVPWESRPWFWRADEIYFSHLGIPFSIASVLLPFMLFWRRNRFALPAAIATLITFLVMLPVGFEPHGLYTISLPRYALFIVPVIFGLTLYPFMQWLEQRSGLLAATTMAVALVVFAMYAVQYAFNDRFVPMDYVLWARAHPGTRDIPFDEDRAASVADRLAGPRDVIAIDAGFGSWIQPAFGADLLRPVKFIPPGDGPPQIPADARFVVVDRGYSVGWGNPRFRDLSQAKELLNQGTPTKRELRTILSLMVDPRFRLVSERPAQAVFVRVR